MTTPYVCTVWPTAIPSRASSTRVSFRPYRRSTRAHAWGRVETRRVKIADFLNKIRHPLKAANVVLRSLASALPGGGAFNEIKDGVEAVVDKVTDRSA
jgi:hypothetical protein